ncbi:hypothetical protein INT43_008983 [Umbelopsis isabellina]|uniref:FAD-binding FR-type domain-containing protein n=1 Tax=Mortierella isabellina TaxID=91625 RepID=A0A8H7UFS2_MORIS|nr:hypothetical protein INT43_008983 [Umbelopsis isabellina]
MALANIGVALLLITRNSILKLVSGKSFDELLPLHRWHGLLGLGEICFHAAVQIKVAMEEMTPGSTSLPKDQEHISGFTAFIGLLIVFMSSMEVIRRNSFPLFYLSHITGVLLFIGAGFAHQYSVIVLISPPLFFYFIDRVTRSIRSWGVKTQTVAVTVANQQDITKVVFTKGDVPHKVHPGQFVFLSVNDGTFASKFGNFFDWHPFTISEVLSSKQSECVEQKQVDTAERTRSMDLERSVSIPVEQQANNEPLRASIYMKQQGRFTNKIHSQVMKSEKMLHVNVDGPYGSSNLALERHDVVAFFEAGIGITPSLTMLRDLAEKCTTDPLSVQTTHIYFVWVTTNMNSANVFLPQLMESLKIASSAVSPPHIEFDIYLTRCSAETSYIPPFENMKISFGRPVVQDIISAIDTKHSQSSIALQTCGPNLFMRQAANVANRKGWIVRRETFEF